MTEGVRLWEFPVADLLLLLGNGLAYLAAGYAVFHLFVRRARRLGEMGHY
jgi:ABC-2 type transport system permease protein